MLKNISLISLLLLSLTQLTGCGGGSDNGDSEEIVPTDSALITSRSPALNSINVAKNADLTITGDPSIINKDLYVYVTNVGQNDNCTVDWSGYISCPSTRFASGFASNLQGNTATWVWTSDLEANTNYIVIATNEGTSSPDDNFALYWTFRTRNSGVFLDSPIINIGYRTETLQGVTNPLGEYNFLPGETVTFFIGDLVFPTVAASGTVTPLDLAGTTDINNPKVVNMIRLLQTLDQDQNPVNGLAITDAAKAAATPVDFSLPVTAFENSAAVTTLITNAGQLTPVSNLVTAAAAQSHFQTQLDILEGLKFNPNTLPETYVVVAPGEGTTRYTFNANGSVAIVFPDGVLDVGNTLQASWTVNADGQLQFSGPISDTFTITSGNQTSGALYIVFNDPTGISHSTGTIELVRGTAFDGSYNVSFISTTPLNNANFQCGNGSGVVNIVKSIVTGSISADTSGPTLSVIGIVQSDGSISGALAVNSVLFTNFTGVVSGTPGGTWNDQTGCAGTWEMIKN